MAINTNMASGNITSNSIEVRAWYQDTTGNQLAYRCQFRINRVEFDNDYYDEYSGYSQTNWTTRWVTATGLEPNTEYQFVARFFDRFGTRLVETSVFYFTTSSGGGFPSTPDPWITNISDTTARANWDSDIYADEFEWELFRGSTLYDYGYTTRTYVNLTSLVPGIEYNIRVRAWKGNSSTVWSGKIYFTTLVLRPSNWSWEYTIASGQPFYNQLDTTAYIMRATHWNNFIVRINEFQRYRLGYETYMRGANTSDTISDIRTCVNDAIEGVNEMLTSANKIPYLYVGDNIAAITFINLRDKLNSIP